MARATTAKRTAATTGSAADFLPERRTLPALRRAAAGCRGCHLWKVGTQTVFGEGKRTATVMFVGEQPGDQEDRAGHPFVGPSGRLLDGALERAGLDRRDAYVTNAVKHFKWVPDPNGKRRIHKTPSTSEVRACHPWLDEEIAVVQPRVIVALGKTAATRLLGVEASLASLRGRVHDYHGIPVVVTYHPAYLLRSLAEKAKAWEDLVFARRTLAAA